MNTIKFFVLCNENIHISHMLRTRENTDVFITLDENNFLGVCTVCPGLFVQRFGVIN